MNELERYSQWINHPDVDKETKSELLSLSGDEAEIKDRFYKDLEFGTAGLRGKLGAGTNRMNYYTVGRATQGIAEFIKEKGKEYRERGVVIAYDCRHFSREFASYAAQILAANDIHSYIFKSLRPTPELSFAIRTLQAVSGINITASHNPKEYNGYKVYWEDGAQVMQDIADSMTVRINCVDMFHDVKSMTLEEAVKQKLITVLEEDTDRAYIDLVKSLHIRDGAELDKEIPIVYTPLNGAGSIPVQTILRERGFSQLHVVPEQEDPDPDFTTVGYPNPEDPKAFRLAEILGERVGAELLVATDPDSDRLAIEVRDSTGTYVPLNGNQTGVILINYLLEGLKETGALPPNGAMVKSIVTGDMGTAICQAYGVRMYEALTGFKNICGQVPRLEKDGYRYLFGYEESIGYAASDKVRDKDGISAAMLLCEAAAYYRRQGLSLLEMLDSLYKTYGYYKEEQVSLVLEGAEGSARIGRMMTEYRKNYIHEFAESVVTSVVDYKNGYQDIPPSDVLKFILSDGSWFALRPSGTEPKIKLYLYTHSDNEAASLQTLKTMKEKVLENLNRIN